MTRDQMQYDVVIVGGGPAGLSAACRLKQLNNELSVCLLEKGAEIGSHIVSGAVFEPRALRELFSAEVLKSAPLSNPVLSEEWCYFPTAQTSLTIPNAILPNQLHNKGNYVISLGQLCHWLGEQASNLGVDIFPGFTAQEVLYNEENVVIGVITGDMGRAANGEPKNEFTPGIELIGKYTLFCEGARGHLGKSLINRFNLAEGKEPQHYGLGIKEIWKVKPENHHAGNVMHSLGWPLSESNTTGGGFAYHFEENLVSIGLISDLAYTNPYFSPFDEFQRFKHHPKIAAILSGGERISYGARVITKGGIQSQPKMTFPGGFLLGDDAGTLNFAKIKGSHTAMKTGLLAAEAVVSALKERGEGLDLIEFSESYKQSWAYEELITQRNIGPAQHKLGGFLGPIYSFFDMHVKGKVPWTFRNPIPDHAKLQKISDVEPINYPKPDGKLSFDKMSSVYLSNTFHEENQPCHLILSDADIPLRDNLPIYGEPAQRYCPAGVYEVITTGEGKNTFQINSQNCVHCKTCDIKDPAQNIAWTAPEGGGGPQYQKM